MLRCWLNDSDYTDYNLVPPTLEFADKETLEKWIRVTLGWKYEDYDAKGYPLEIDHDSVIWWSCIGYIDE